MQKITFQRLRALKIEQEIIIHHNSTEKGRKRTVLFFPVNRYLAVMERDYWKDTEHMHAEICSCEDEFHSPQIVLVEAQAAEQSAVLRRRR